jgi:Tol biopolymer transport system component
VNSRFTSDPGAHANPTWSFDGSQVAFAAQRGGVWGIYQKASNDLTGNGELLYTSGNRPARPTSWSRDGRFLLFHAGTPYDIWALPLSAGAARRTARTPLVLVKGPFYERGARFSPEGRFYAYVSNRSGVDEIYVQTFDPSASGTLPAEAVQISKDGGDAARWSADGKEIFYRSPNGTDGCRGFPQTPVFRAEAPRLLFKAPPSSHPNCFLDIAPDGQRFLFALPHPEFGAIDSRPELAGSSQALRKVAGMKPSGGDKSSSCTTGPGNGGEPARVVFA